MDVNDDLQATYQIMKLFEIAKSHSDQILDSSPGIYALFGPTGSIYRGNIQLAEKLDVHFESLHLSDLKEFITEQCWGEFQKKMAESKACEREGLSFEMDIKEEDNFIKTYLFNLRPVWLDRKNKKLIYTLLGQDTTSTKKAAIELGRMRAELKTAKDIQDTLFVDQIGSYGSVEVVGSNDSAFECGGDWWYHKEIDGKVFVGIGDVTGNGVAAALVTAGVRGAFTLLEGEQELTPEKILVQLNRAVYSISRGKRLMTFFVSSIDLKSGICRYANAGHPFPYLFVKSSEGPGQKFQVQTLSSAASHILGMRENARFVETSIQLNAGDFIFAFTDGIKEAHGRNSTKNMTLNFVEAILRAEAETDDIQGMHDSFKKSLKEFQLADKPLDDQTFFILQKRK